MKQLVLALLLSTAAISPALADQVTTASKFDERIRYVSYNGADVVKVDTVAGIATHIKLEDGEEYVTHAFGDAEAWSFAVEKNHVFIKPRADRADTNLIVVTDKRTYNFQLVYHSKSDAPSVFQLSFHYPDTVAKQAAVVREAKALEAGFAVPAGPSRTNYTMAGDYTIAPLNVWDDGKFTYFKFPGNRDFPAIYMVDPDGRESIVNRNSVGKSSDVVVVQKVNEKWSLRLGQQALAVFNEDMIAAGDVPITTNPYAASGTSSPVVERLVKGGGQ